MPYKYIGRKTSFQGKTLWEIVGNLKNFGVGRVVFRNMFARYPEPSYLRILKVETLANPEEPSIDNVRKVKVWVERTFRGVTDPKPVLIESASYKTDYKLVPKDEEATFCTGKVKEIEKILPKYMELPPILKELIIREMKSKGETVDEDPKMEVVYKKNVLSKYRVAGDGETPTVDFTRGYGDSKHQSLYEIRK